MISCAASFCPLRFVAAHVCMLRWPRPLDLAFWGQSDTSDMFCLFSAHILVPAKVALCSLRTGLYRVWMHAAISTVLAIQWTSRALSALNTCNYSHYPQSPPALPFLPLPLSVFLLTFSSGSHRGKGGERLTSTKERAAIKDGDVWSMIKKLGNKARDKIMRKTRGTRLKAWMTPYIKNMLYVVF